MTSRVELSSRAIADLRRIFRAINAEHSVEAAAWFNGLERAILGLEKFPGRCPATPENRSLRHLLYGRRRNVYRAIFSIDEGNAVVTVVHIRHGARRGFSRGEV